MDEPRPADGLMPPPDERETIELDAIGAPPAEPPAEPAAAPGGPPKGISFVQGISLVVGLQIGSGVFSSPNQIHIQTGSIGASLLVWIAGGLLAWTGASCYAELGSAIPRSGGAKTYIQYIYGDHLAHLFSWAALIVIKPASAAIIASVLGEYASRHAVVKRVVAAAAILATSAANWFRVGAAASTFFLALKFVLLAAVVAASIVLTARRDLSSESVWGGTRDFPHVVAGLFGGLWAYDGWDNLNFVAGEMQNPQRDLPRVIAISMPLVALAYLVVNLGYFGALSGPELDASTSVALTIAKQLHSSALALVLAVGIMLSCAGALNATIFSATRLVQVVAEDGVLPKLLAKHGLALLFQAVLTIAYVCIGEFSSLVEFYGAMACLFYAVVGAGLVRLRWTEPHLARPYRTWPLTPLVFIGLTGGLLLRTLVEHPLVIPATLVFFLLGSLLYWYRTHGTSAQTSNKTAEQSDPSHDPIGHTDSDSEYEV